MASSVGLLELMYRGYGSIALYIYTAGVLVVHFGLNTQLYWLMVLMPVLFVNIVINYHHTHIYRRLFGDRMVEAYKKLKENQETEGHHYEGRSDKLQKRIDKLDDELAEELFSFLSGILMILGLPLMWPFFHPFDPAFQILGLMVAAVFIFIIFIYNSFNKMLEIIDHIEHL